MTTLETRIRLILQDRRKTRNYMILSVFVLYVFLIHKSFFNTSGSTTKSLASNYDFTKPIPEECQDEIIVNGSFKEGTKGWKFIGPSTGMKLVQGVTGKGLSTVTREKWYFGQAQTINKECFRRGEKYVITADVTIEDYEGNAAKCDPFNKFFSSEACPTFALKLTGKDIKTKEIGMPVGPWKFNQWNKIYGIFEATDDIFHADSLDLYITKLQSGYNAIIDNVSMKKVDDLTFGVGSCLQLIRNGDAEVGDARFWLIKGNGETGSIHAEFPGASGKYAFIHRGDRQHASNGMWQSIDRSCLTPNSTWKISLKMILLDASGEETSCDKTQISGDASCPTIIIESHTPDKGIVTDNLRNEAPGHWESNDWNTFETTFTVTDEHLEKEETTIFLNNIPSSYGYKIDDFTMTRYLSE